MGTLDKSPNLPEPQFPPLSNKGCALDERPFPTLEIHLKYNLEKINTLFSVDKASVSKTSKSPLYYWLGRRIGYWEDRRCPLTICPLPLPPELYDSATQITIRFFKTPWSFLRPGPCTIFQRHGKLSISPFHSSGSPNSLQTSVELAPLWKRLPWLSQVDSARLGILVCFKCHYYILSKL